VADIDRPSFPVAGLVITALVVIGVISVVNLVVGTILWLVRSAVLIALVVVVFAFLTRGRGRRG
jgi:hypothetical protein